jgi:hypothetical protein
MFSQVLFLQKREHNRKTATLVTGESGGLVRAWSIFGGGLLGQFVAGHTDSESITALTTDENNTMLITGDTMGYVRVRTFKNLYIANNRPFMLPAPS